MRESFTCKRGSLTIRGHIWGRTSKSQDAVILSHGFLANEKMCHAYAELLANLGYLAITYDFCGGGLFSRSDGRSEDMTVFTEVDDLKAVIEAVSKEHDPQAVSLLGCSQGGFVSGLVAAELGTQKISRLIMFYPAVCIPDDAHNGKMLFYRFDPENVPAVLGRFPMKLGGEYARTAMQIDPFIHMSGYDGPVLLVHGTKDSVVDIRYARKLRDVYRNCTYKEIEGAGHVFKGSYDKQACDILASFMKG